jgi:nucleotide-binding universal stress UspA family protein
VVVGVDGSQGSARALAWALREARDRQVPLRVVTAWAWDGAAATGSGVSTARQARQLQEALVRAVLAGFPGALPQLSAELVQGDAASALIERSRGADLLVLGSRGLGSRTEAVVGCVADACLRHGGCPVVVIPADTTPPLPDAPPATARRTGVAPAVLAAVGLL